VEELTPFENLIESTLQLAKIVRAYYDHLLECGFSENQAMALATQYQKDIINMAKSNNNSAG
jgi:hypothetical protein